MHPVLFQIGPVRIGAYAVLLGVGLILGLVLVRSLARRDDLPGGRVVDLAVLIVLGALVGARLGHVLTHLPAYLARPPAMLYLGDGGFSFYGGVIGGLGVGLILAPRVFGLPVWRTADLFAPALVLAAYFGRLGSLAAGWCWGLPARVPWAMSFPAKSLVFKTYHDLYQTWGLWFSALRPELGAWAAAVHPAGPVWGPATPDQIAPALAATAAQAQALAAQALSYLAPDAAGRYLKTVPLYPTQVYLALGLFVIFVLSLWLLGRRRFYGQVWWTVGLCFAVLKALVEPWRGDVHLEPDVLGLLSRTQAWSLALGSISIWMLIILWRRGRRRAPGLGGRLLQSERGLKTF
ncbi:MAG: prolipoprotein diacylglyceryl transferase [Proteobacteria bacterium]|nr:prolipoprotein diacylglyceryl transferase [Pseudomonadota bacterium]